MLRRRGGQMCMRSEAPLDRGEAAVAGSERPTAADAAVMRGVVKWFDVTRGFGFMVADDPAVGDILVHFSVVQPHGRRSLPEGARVMCRRSARDAGCRRARCCRST